MFSLRASLISFAVLAMTANSAYGQLSYTCLTTGFIANCAQFIDGFCDHATAGDNLGRYRPRDNFSRCYNDGGHKCDLTVWFSNPASENQLATPSNVNCKNALRTISNNCGRGGSGRFNGGSFQFSIDPNTGECGGFAAAGPANREAGDEA